MSIYKSILNNFDEAIKLIDQDFEIIYANKAALRLYDLDIIGKTCSEIGVEGGLIEKQIKRIEQNIIDSKDEFFIKRDLSGKAFYELTVMPILDESKNKLFLVKTIDITTRKLFENDMFQKERLATLGQVASSLAHEIRNPITGIRLGLDILENERLSQSSKEVLNSITNDIDRLSIILKQLLDYSKIHEKSKEEVNINKLIEESLVLLRKEAEANEISIHTDYSEIITKVIVDKNQIHQAIVNLILNAIQAIETEGTITITTSNINVNDILGVQILIQDNGVGIAKENLFKINNLFFTTKEDGTGLGLPMSQKIIREHGGSIVFESEESIGTTVKLFLPIEI